MQNNDKIEKALRKGYVQLENGNIKRACEIYKDTLKQNPDNIALINNLAQASAMMGEIKESKYHYKRLIELCENENSREMLILKANSQMKINNLSDALETYRKVLSENPRDIPTLFQMADIYREKGEIEKSNSCLDLILDAENENVPAIIRKGQNHQAEDENEKALECYSRALELSPKHEEAIRLKGELLKQMGKSEELKRHISTTLKIKPDSAYTLMLKAMEYANADDDKKTLEFFNKAISVDPFLDEAYFNKAGFLMLKKRYDEAIECYRQAFEINPESGGIIDKEGLFELLNQMKAKEQ